MKKNILHFFAFLFLVSVISCENHSQTDAVKAADSTNNAKVDSAKKADTIASVNSHMADMKPDAEFAVAAADGGQLEVELGKMAVKSGTTKQIRALGAMMVKDHTKANVELKALSITKNITLPDTLSYKCQKTIADLGSKTGKDFNKAYADLMVSDHKDDIDDFKKEAEKGNDAGLSAWAKNKVPVLEHHLMMSEQAKKMADQ